MRKTGGINPKIAFWMYKTILSPKLLYASAVCRSRVNRVEARNLPQSIQGCYVIAGGGYMTTTPTEGAGSIPLVILWN